MDVRRLHTPLFRGLVLIRSAIPCFRTELEAELRELIAAGDLDSYAARPGIERWNGIGKALIRLEQYKLAEDLYREALDKQLAVEHATGHRLHKGHTYFNLGACQYMQGNLDEAIQNMLLAAQEDDETGAGTHSHARSEIERVVIDPEKRHLAGALGRLCASLNMDATALATDLLESFPLEQRLFAAAALRDSRTAGRTDYGRGLRLLALRESCLLFESWLRAKGYAGTSLKELLQQAYSGCKDAWWPSVCQIWDKRGATSADSSADIAARLANFASATPAGTSDDLLARAHAQAVLLRNYTNHRFELSGPEFADPLYQELFRAVWLCMLYAQQNLPCEQLCQDLNGGIRRTW